MKPRRARMAEKLGEYWRRLYNNSDTRKMSRGSQNLSKIISWARGENWRRKEDKK